MFSSVGGFRFLSGFSLGEGIYLMSNIGDIVQGFQTSGANAFFASENSSSGNIVMTKLGLGATTVWSKELTGSGTSEAPNNLILDSSYNSIVVGQTSSVGNTDMYISKFDSTGNLSWQRTIGDTAGDSAIDVALVDSQANIVVTGKLDDGTNTYAFAAKLASSNGSLLSQQKIIGSYIVEAITTDASGNMYMLCSETLDASRNNAVIFKCQSDFTIIWQKQIGYSTGTTDFKGRNIAVDASNNVYATIKRVSASEDFLVKLDSSGTLQWQTTFNYGTNNGFTGIAIDSMGNIYIAGYFGSPTTTVQLLKLDSSGALSWGRGLSGYGGGAESCGVYNISWYGGKILVNGYSSYAGTQYGMLLNVADDGSGVGTYADGYIWGFSPFSLATSSLVVNTNSASFSTTSLTDAAGTLTSSNFTTSVAHNIGF